MSRWFVEAWTLPGSSPFQRRVMEVPGRTAFRVPASGAGRISIDVPKEWGRLDEVLDPANDVGSLLRLIETDRAGDPQIRGEFVTRTTQHPYSEGPVTKITAPSIEEALEWAVMYPYDWPPPIVQADWLIGSGEAVGSFTNGGFEDQEINGDAETGDLSPWEGTPDDSTFKAPTSIGVSTTDPASGVYAFDITPSGLHSGMTLINLEVIGGERLDVSAVLKETTAAGRRYTMYVRFGSGSTLNVGAKVWSGWALAELDGAAYTAGASDGTYQTLDCAVTFGPDVTETQIVIHYDDHDGGAVLPFTVDDITLTGAAIGVLPWEQVGTLDTFELDTAIQRSGTNSLQWKVNAGSGADASGVRQKVTDLIVGRQYTYGAFFEHDAGGNETLSIIAKRPEGAQIASDTVVLPTGSVIDTAYGSVTFVAVGTEVWLDVRYTAAGVSPNIFMDDALIAGGQAAATVGEILIELFADANVDHTGEAGDFARDTLDWIKLDFSATLDTDGNAWLQNESITLRAGKSYGKVMSDFSALGYEYRLKPNPSFPSPDSESHVLQVYNPSDPATRIGGASNDLVGSVGFSSGDVTAGPIVRRSKTRTVALAQGAGDLWSVDKDAAGVTAWGARELYVRGTDLTDTATLDQAAANALLERAASLQASTIQIVDTDHFSPFIDFDPGDWVRGDLGGEIPRGDHRIVAVTGTLDGGLAEFGLDLGAQVFVGSAGTSEAVRRLLTKFDVAGAGDTTVAQAAASTPFTGPIEVTLLVASSTASAAMQAVADFVCDGADDDLEIQFALDQLPAAGGRVMLTEGTFTIGTKITIPTKAVLSGVGWSTLIQTTGFGLDAIEVQAGTNQSIENLSIDNPSGLDGIYVLSGVTFLTIRNCHIIADNGGGGYPIQGQGSPSGQSDISIVRCYLESGSSGEHAIWFKDTPRVRVIENHVAVGFVTLRTTSAGLYAAQIIGNYIYDGGIEVESDGIISGNVIELSQGDAIELSDGPWLVSGNYFYATEDWAVRVTSGTNIITGNVFWLSGQFSDGTAGHIRVTASGDGTYIHGNIFKQATGAPRELWGIQLDSGAADVRIGENEYSNIDGFHSSGGVVLDNGTDTKHHDRDQQTWTMAGVLSVKTGLLRISFPNDVTLIDVKAQVAAAPTGTTVIVDLHKDGVTMFTTQLNRPTVALATTEDTGIPDVTVLVAGSYLTVDVDQIDSNAIATDLTVTVRYRRAF